MLPKDVIKDFIENFNVLDNKRADVYIKHILYGQQKINKCVLHPLTDGGRIGLIINGEEKYITMDELCEVHIDTEKCCLKSDVMELYIDYTTL